MIATLLDWLYRLSLIATYGVGPFFIWYIIWAERKAKEVQRGDD
jgi:hypothetical protein